jgi:replicative DNA helicase
MIDTREMEKLIVSTALNGEDELLQSLQAVWFSNNKYRKIIENLQEGHTIETVATGTGMNLSDIAVLIPYNQFPVLSYGYRDQLRDSYTKNQVEKQLKALNDGGSITETVDAIHGLINSASSGDDVLTAKDALYKATDEIRRAMDRKDELIFSPFGNINRLVGGFMPGRLITIAGRPGVGKSAFVLQMATSIARRKHKVLYVSLEMLAEELAIRLISTHTGIDSTQMSNGTIEPDRYTKIASAADELKSLNLYITNQGREITKLERLIRREKPEIVIVDSLNLMRAKGESERVRIMSITRSMKELAMKLNIPIIMIAQLNRAADEKDMPTLSDLKESGSIEEDSDVVILLSDVKKEDHYHTLNDAYKAKTGGYLDDINAFTRAERSGDKIVLASVAKNRSGATGKAVFWCKTSRYFFSELPERK